MKALCVLALLPGCALTTIGGTMTATRPYTPAPHTAADVELHLIGDDPPACAFTRVGMITYDGNKTGVPWGRDLTATDAEALEGLRKFVASKGLDGALEVRCGGSGTTGSGMCDGVAYVCAPAGTP